MLKIKDLKGEMPATCIFTPDNELDGYPLIAENAEKIAEIIEKSVKNQGCTDFKREGETLYFGNQFFKLPVYPSKRQGVINFRSADFTFSSPEFKNGAPVYGQKPKAAEFNGKSWKRQCAGGTLEYILNI